MARPKIPSLDWHKELAIIEPFFQGKGGVLHIRTTDKSPSSAFCKILRSKMEHSDWPKKWISVQIDADNAATHYFSDMIYQIEKSLGIGFKAGVSPGSHTIASNMSAGHDVNIENINVYSGNTSQESSLILQDRICQILKHLNETLHHTRLCIIFFNSHAIDTRELSAFRTEFWNEFIGKLVDKGLLLIDFNNGTPSNHFWPPDADALIELHERYDAHSIINATDDMAKFLIEQKYYTTVEEANAFAAGIFAMNDYPRDVYAQFASIISRIRPAT